MLDHFEMFNQQMKVVLQPWFLITPNNSTLLNMKPDWRRKIRFVLHPIINKTKKHTVRNHRVKCHVFLSKIRGEIGENSLIETYQTMHIHLTANIYSIYVIMQMDAF